MLEAVAMHALGWTRHLEVEVALVAPMCGGRAITLLAVAIGDRSSVALDPATVFRPALACGAEAVVVIHNHPGGALPSEHDHACTRRLVAAGSLLGVPMVGHLVLLPSGWVDCAHDPDQIRLWSWRDAA